MKKKERPKVGDVVRLIRRWDESGCPPINATATVTEVDINAYAVRLQWHDREYFPPHTRYSYHGWFELADGGPW